MKQRVITGIIFGAVVLALLLFHNVGRLILLALIPILSLIEYSQMTKFKLIDWLLFFMLVTTVFLLCANSVHPAFILIPICILNFVLIGNLYLNAPKIKHEKFKSILAALYIVSPFVVAYFQELHSSLYYLFIGIMILIWVSDSSAYFVGSQIGKRKFFPSISPKKTWEGFYGAGMCVMLFSYVIFSLTQFSTFQFWLFFGLIIWILGALGDLVASHVKRLHSIKDSGNLLPGHGGFYDRFDAFIFVLPFVLLLHTLTT